MLGVCNSDSQLPSIQINTELLYMSNKHYIIALRSLNLINSTYYPILHKSTCRQWITGDFTDFCCCYWAEGKDLAGNKSNEIQKPRGWMHIILRGWSFNRQWVILAQMVIGWHSSTKLWVWQKDRRGQWTIHHSELGRSRNQQKKSFTTDILIYDSGWNSLQTYCSGCHISKPQRYHSYLLTVKGKTTD